MYSSKESTYITVGSTFSSWLRIVGFVLCLTLISGAAWAQTTSTGTVVGQVTDPSGAVVTNATVTMTDTATNAKRTTKTNQTGAYVFVNVLPGKYDITASQTGFAEARVLG